MIGRTLITAAVLALLTGCAVRLGGPSPVEYRTVAVSTAGGVSPAEVARWIREVDANVVLLSATADSAWFGDVARETRMTLSGPGRAGEASLAFLAGVAVGDTTVALALESGGEIVLHDALYQIDDYRFLDLIALRAEPGESPRDIVRALLGYVATDVMPNAATLLAVDVADAAVGDSIAALLSPAFLDAQACLPGSATAGAGASPRMRLFYGPQARVHCSEARVLDGGSGPVVAHIVVRR